MTSEPCKVQTNTVAEMHTDNFSFSISRDRAINNNREKRRDQQGLLLKQKKPSPVMGHTLSVAVKVMLMLMMMKWPAERMQ